MHVRRIARKLALEALYEIDCADHALHDVLGRRLDTEALDEPTSDFLRTIVKGTVEHRNTLDAIIAEYAPEWPVDQMAIIDRNILRIAIYEIIFKRQTPLKVAINEAVELAKIYGSDSAPRFVNGVLGTLATKKEELISRHVDDNSTK